MVLWGQSAGSISVDYYNFAHAADPIVEGLIMDSGTAQSPIAVSNTDHSNFTFVAEHVGCSGLATKPAQQLECMRGVSATVIEDFVATYAESAVTPALSFSPIVDEVDVFSNYTQRGLDGLQAQIVCCALLKYINSS